jgi:membrane-associated phospholipid phosphatase
VYAVWHSGIRGLLLVGLMVSAIVIADQSIIYIKDYVARERPCRALPALGVQVRLLVECGTGKSFPSAHAANNLAAAVLAGFMFPRVRAVVLALAWLVAFSRVYCGVHYPSDVVAGAVYGLVIAVAVKKAGLLLPVLKNVMPPPQNSHYQEVADKKHPTTQSTNTQQ